MSLLVPANAKEVTMELVVTRCGCGLPNTHNGTQGEVLPCPSPLPFNAATDRRFLYWHRNRFRRLWFTLKTFWR